MYSFVHEQVTSFEILKEKNIYINLERALTWKKNLL